ncbi:MAG TPA: DUF177 domain-containing protein [Solirubrobacteraceae bacterium]|nr:DUF177 domain-containing protein [Solirubrobacteraceae bacterium]
MPLITDVFDLAALRLTAGEGRRLDLVVALEPFELSGETYRVEPSHVPVHLDISRTTGDGYSLRLRLRTKLAGPCMRCLEPSSPGFEVDAREVFQPGGGEELESPYVERGELALGAWARDALALTLPASVLCLADCAGLCPVCGADLNVAGPDHAHERPPDPRWAKLSELRFD